MLSVTQVSAVHATSPRRQQQTAAVRVARDRRTGKHEQTNKQI